MCMCVLLLLLLFFSFFLGALACKWEITTLIVIFDDRPSSTVVKKSFQSIYYTKIAIQFMSNTTYNKTGLNYHTCFTNRAATKGWQEPGVSPNYFHSNKENIRPKDLPSHSIHFRFPHFAYALVAHI